MKTSCRFLIITLLTSTLFACKKNKSEPVDPTELKGTWELESARSSMMPLTTYEEGNGNLLKIKDDSYAYYKDGAVTEQGNYAAYKDTVTVPYTCQAGPNGKYQNRFANSNITSPRVSPLFKIYYYVEDNKLYMASGCWALDSGSEEVYRRK